MRKIAQDAVWAHGPRKIAAALGCNDSTIYHWLAGKSTPRFDSAAKVAELLKAANKKSRVTVEDLMAPTDTPIVEKIDHRTVAQRRKNSNV